MKRLVAVVLTTALAFGVNVASAQRPLLNGLGSGGGIGSGIGSGGGIGSGLGARLTGRNQQAAPVNEGLPMEAASDGMPGQTVPVAPQATPAANAASAQSGAAQQPAKAPLKKSDGSEFAIPANATVAQLLEQTESLLSTEVAFETEKEYETWLAQMLATVIKISDRIFGMETDDDSFVQAISYKGQALCFQASIDSAKYLTKLGSYAGQLEKNKRVQSLEEGRNAAIAFKGVYLQAKVADIAERNGTSKELVAAMNDVSAFIKQYPETSDMTVDLVFPVMVIAQNQKDPKLPAQIWTPIRKQLKESDAPEAKSALQMLEGTIRYSELEGAEFVWKGNDLDGKPLDQSLVKGRVVVVDFWASWNESYPQLHQQLQQLYTKYHESGFEIVSYNLDAQKDDMNAYLTKNPLPWIQLSDRATVDAKATSLAAYYGIAEVPTLILIGGDGKVAALDISLESLVATLESVFNGTNAAKVAAQNAAAEGAAEEAAPATAAATGAKTPAKSGAKSATTSAKSGASSAAKSGATSGAKTSAKPAASKGGVNASTTRAKKN